MNAIKDNKCLLIRLKESQWWSAKKKPRPTYAYWTFSNIYAHQPTELDGYPWWEEEKKLARTSNLPYTEIWLSLVIRIDSTTNLHMVCICMKTQIVHAIDFNVLAIYDSFRTDWTNWKNALHIRINEQSDRTLNIHREWSMFHAHRRRNLNQIRWRVNTMSREQWN